MTLKQWAHHWKEASEKLSEVRAKDIRSIQTKEAILSFNKAFSSVILKENPKSTSGLVELQKIFRKLKI